MRFGYSEDCRTFSFHSDKEEKNKDKNIKITLYRPMEFPIKFDTVKLGGSIVVLRG